MLIQFCKDKFDIAQTEYARWIENDNNGLQAFEEQNLARIVSWLKKYNVARNFSKDNEIREGAIEIIRQNIRPEKKFDALCTHLSGNKFSLCSKLVWLSTPENSFMFDRFVHRAIVVLTRLSTDEPFPEDPSAQNLLESWNLAVLRIHNRWLPHIRARMPPDLQGVRHERRITDKLLMLLGGATF